MKTSYKLISNINEYDDAEPLEIRVIKKWTPDLQSSEFCYIFVDVHGDAIQVTTSLDEESNFDLKITIQSCYIVDKYISLPQKSHNLVVPHKACLRIGKKATFVPTTNNNIPNHYYAFANYSDLPSRTKPSKMLTDYIGRVENNKQIITKTGKRLKRVTIQDIRENVLQVTFWPAQSSILPDDVKTGDILAITSTNVKEFEEQFQLETTAATTVAINPTSSYIRTYMDRLRKLSPKSEALGMNLVTIAELLSKNTQERTQKRFSCLARVKSIHTNRNWYYVLCPNCPKKMYPQKGPTIKFVCEDDENIENPKFMYCVNATITDDTSVADVIFFNDAMTNLLNIKCEDMIINHGYTDQHIIPDKMLSIINKSKLFVITVKPDCTIVINNVHEPPSNIFPPTTTSTITLTPKTPAGKTSSTKRSHQNIKDKDA